MSRRADGQEHWAGRDTCQRSVRWQLVGVEQHLPAAAWRASHLLAPAGGVVVPPQLPALVLIAALFAPSKHTAVRDTLLGIFTLYTYYMYIFSFG